MRRLANVRGFLLAAAFALGTGASAQDAPDHGGVMLQWAGGSHALRATLGWETPVLWTHRAANGSGRIELTGEIGLSYWDATQGREPASLWQINAIPMLRWWPHDGRFFVEGGIGPTLVSHTRFAGRSISTAYQFGDHLGVGYQITPAARISLRVSHFSNADIKTPNPGFTLVQLGWTYLY